MIDPRLTTCAECTTITNLLAKIDCKMAEMAKMLYNNMTLMLGYKINYSAILDLLNYKRILTYKSYNLDYAPDYTIEMIASRIIVMTGNCKSKCQQTISTPPTTTTTTTLTI